MVRSNISIFLVLLNYLTNFSHCTTIDDYCKVNTQNTPCATECTRADSCGDTGDTYVPLTYDERQILLDIHNSYREGVAAGNYSASQLPACVGGIKALSYSLELEFLAACWINQCMFAHDKVRLNARGEKVGQNLHQVYSSSVLGRLPNFLTNGVSRWFNEHKLLTPADANITHSFYSKKGVGHLTAMTWGKTEQVGCAKMHFMQPRRGQPEQIVHAYSLYCNYWPSGNWLRTPIYEDTECEKFNEQWPHLCGEFRPLEEDEYQAPQVGGTSESSEEGEEYSGKSRSKEARQSTFLPPLYILLHVARKMI